MLTENDCPAMFSNYPSYDLTDQYHFVSSKKIADQLQDRGWDARVAFYRKPRQGSDPLHRQHCVRFTMRDDTADPSKGRAEIVLTNSHDGSCSLSLLAGIFRMVCTNGLTIAEESYGGLKLRHDNQYLRILGDNWLASRIDTLCSEVPEKVEASNRWSDIIMSKDQRYDFYEQAGTLRGLDMWRHRYYTFDQALRSEDRDHDLWTVYNRTQERLQRGGITNWFDNRPDRKRRKRELGPISDVKRMEHINTELWKMAESYASVN